MKAFDQELSSRLHAAMDDEPMPVAPTHLLLQRGKRARRVRAAATTGGFLAVAGVIAVAVAAPPAAMTDRPAATGAAPSVEPASPRVELAAAIANSENISFKLKTTTAGQKGDGKITLPRWEYVTESAFDPATVTGYVRSKEGVKNIDIRLINGVKYAANVADPTQFLQFKGKHDSLGFGHVHTELGASADPERLFQALRDSGAKIAKTGPTGYHFEATTEEEEGGTVTLAGDVTVGPDKRVAKVAYSWKLKYPQGGFRDFDVTLEFSDYGFPVTVERPANALLED